MLTSTDSHTGDSSPQRPNALRGGNLARRVHDARVNGARRRVDDLHSGLHTRTSASHSRHQVCGGAFSGEAYLDCVYWVHDRVLLFRGSDNRRLPCVRARGSGKRYESTMMPAKAPANRFDARLPPPRLSYSISSISMAGIWSAIPSLDMVGDAVVVVTSGSAGRRVAGSGGVGGTRVAELCEGEEGEYDVGGKTSKRS